MRMFAVILNEANPEIAERIAESYPTHYRFSDTVFLVSDDALAETVSVNVGIKGDDRVDEARGVVFRLNGAYAGYTKRALWEWLSEAEGRE